jgi:methyltransferase family protein
MTPGGANAGGRPVQNVPMTFYRDRIYPRVVKALGNPEATKIFALEPNPGMRRLAQRERARTPIDVTFLDLPGESLPLENSAVDTVLSPFTMCTIPGGRLIFVEHGLAPDPSTQRWQRWTEPIPYWLFEGCHVSRDIPSIIESGGFRIDDVEKGYLAPFPKSWTYTWWGSALPVA